jgi:hypothetical protein
LCCIDFEPEKRICIWLNSIHNKHLSETWIYEKRLRLWFISQCNLLVTLFETNILSSCLVLFYRWGSLHSWILLLCFKGKNLISFIMYMQIKKKNSSLSNVIL